MTSRSVIPESEIKKKMATLDDSPSLFSGQQWTDWAASVLPDNELEQANCDTADDETDAESMKLRIEDMPLFGICPSRDEFYLVVCDKCNQVLKPQAFQAHLDIRHGGKGSYTSSSTKSHQSSSRLSVSSKSHSKSHSSSKPHRSSHTKSHSLPNKSSHRSHSHSRLKPSPLEEDLVNSGQDSISRVVNENINVYEDVKPELLAEASVTEPSQSLDTATRVGAGTDTESVKDSSVKNSSSSVPVVKVERIPENVSIKKHMDSSGSARTSPLTNGSLRGAKSPPASMPVITDSDEDVISTNTSMPELKSSQDTEDLYLEEMDTVPVSEINDAVSSILEPSSPVSESETGRFMALATSSSTITTDTVTMATITTSTTTVTNVINTNSSFTFGSMGRPSFPMGSIRVNFSSTGVLNSITGGDSNSNNNNNNNNNSTTWTKSSSVTSEPYKTTVCSNGSMESTISDIVKSAVNSGNTGGFKSLSPLLISPNKSNSVGNASSSFKSPTKLGNLVKSSSSSSLNKAGSKLSSGLSNVFKSSSAGNVVVTSGTGSGVTGASSVNTEAIKKFQLLNKPDKIIPLKDREYDPNKHCGVVVAETGKPCTRSLTCKSHALSLRRAVHGRRLPFDDLLKEHREAKEAYQKAKVESKEATAALKAVQAANKGQVTHIVTPHGKLHNLTTIASPVVKSNSHLNQTLNKENKTVTGSVFPASKPLTLQKPASISSQRLSLSSIGSPLSNDEVQSPTGKLGEKFSNDDGDDNSFTSYHPRPIAACSFGARYHNSYGSGLNNYGSGLGCYTFGRKMDHLRSAFLDLLEKHSNPPPPKKLCVEANLPREQDTTQANSDPYDFVLMDPNRNHLNQHIIQGPSGVISSTVPNKVVSKQSKTKIIGNSSNHNTYSSSKQKLKDSFLISKSASHTGVNVTPGLLTTNTAKKRLSSGSIQGTVSQANIGATLVSAPNILGSVGTLTNSAGAPQQQQFAIAIPNVNISGAALSQIGASLVASGNLKPGSKNNVIKDNTMGFVVTGIPQEALLNGQIVNITNSQLTTDLSTSQLQTQPQEDVSKPVQQINVISSKQMQQKFGSMDAIRALQTGKGNLITGLPPNAVLLDGLQTGTVLQPVTLTTSTSTSVMSVNNTVFSQQHQNHSSTTNQYIRASTDGHQVSTSPLPNGVVANTSDKDLLLSQRHTVFQNKGISQSAIVQHGRGTMQQTSHIFTGAQLQNPNFTFQTPSSTTLTNQINVNTSQVLPNQLTQLQVKNSGLHKTSTINKMNLHPVSITIPLVTQNNLGGVEMGMGGQQHGHTLFIRSEEAQKQGLHLQPMDQPTQNSPNSLIS
ncbi:Ataxin-7-like protein 1 [Mactra antiquata]